MPDARQTDSVVATASSRLYRRHQRYARSLRLNHSKQELQWLSVQATRMSTTSRLGFRGARYLHRRPDRDELASL